MDESKPLIGGVFFAEDFEQLEEINLDSNLVSDPSVRRVQVDPMRPTVKAPGSRI